MQPTIFLFHRFHFQNRDIEDKIARCSRNVYLSEEAIRWQRDNRASVSSFLQLRVDIENTKFDWIKNITWSWEIGIRPRIFECAWGPESDIEQNDANAVNLGLYTVVDFWLCALAWRIYVSIRAVICEPLGEMEYTIEIVVPKVMPWKNSNAVLKSELLNPESNSALIFEYS